MASRQASTHVNVYESGDYPIILGDSLKDESHARSKYLQMRYNWVPKQGFHRGRSTVKRIKDDFQLDYQEDDSSPSYSYDGFPAGGSDAQDSSRLLLVFDESRSAFVLEGTATSLDFNISSAPGQSREDIRKHPPLPRRPFSDGNLAKSSARHSDDDDEADPDNPFDFRHFLTEAKEAAEKAAQPPPGNRTPLSGVASPLGPRASDNDRPKFKSGVQLPAKAKVSGKSAAPLPSKIKGAPDKAIASAASTSSTSRKVTATGKRKEGPAPSKPASRQQPLSKERISDSDEELSDTITVEPRSGFDKGRNTKNAPSVTSSGRSPNLVVSGDLQIDMGSPPPEPKRKPYKIDPEAFRSKTHTPTIEKSINNSRGPPPRYADEDVEMRDAEPSEPEIDEDNENDDVEAFELSPPPRQTTDEEEEEDEDEQQHPRHQQQSRRSEDEDEEEEEREQARPVSAEDEDDDAALAAELEAALYEEEDNSANERGAVSGYGVVDDDESEVSEEE